MRVLEEGWECPLCEAEALRHGPVALDAGARAGTTPSPRAACASCAALCRAQLACRHQHRRQLHRQQLASCRWFVTSGFSCHARDDLLHGKLFCDCGHRDVLLHSNVVCDCGHRGLHRLPTSPPRWWLPHQLFDTTVHGVDELTETLSHSARLEGLPTRRARTRGHGSRRRAVCARRHSRLVSSSSRG